MLESACLSLRIKTFIKVRMAERIFQSVILEKK